MLGRKPEPPHWYYLLTLCVSFVVTFGVIYVLRPSVWVAVFVGAGLGLAVVVLGTLVWQVVPRVPIGDEVEKWLNENDEDS